MRKRTALTALAALLTLTAAPQAAPLISEFMADNTQTLADEDGDFTDWIEIHNPDAVPVDLAGYALTDNALMPQKWVFPNVTIPAGGFLVVFASAKDRRNPAAQLHTNFALDAAGEYLALVAPDGTTKLTEFAPTFPNQEKDKSFGTEVPTITPITSGAQCRWRVPTAAIANWQAPGFNDSTWNAGNTGVGYEQAPNSAINYTALISPNANTGSLMFNVANRTSCYIRIPFTVADATQVTSMILRMKYDDGFIAYLNGTLVSSANPPSGTPSHTSAASNVNPDNLAVVFEDFDISAFKNLLVSGNNVLAIHGLNESIGSSDFLILPELKMSLDPAGTPLATGYFVTPTPGTVNGTRVDGFVKDTKFSVDRGFFTSAFTVAITTDTPGATIRYTLDSSEPTETNGTVYTGPINITTTRVLRAAAFRTGWVPSDVDTQTYIFAAAVKNQSNTQPGFPTTWGHVYDFSTGGLGTATVPADYQMDPAITTSATYTNLIVPALTSTLPVLSLVGDTAEIFATNGIYSDGRLDFGREIKASIEFFGPGSGTGFNVRCGLRIHGGDALIEHPKKPFRLYFRKDYGPAKLEFPLFPNSPVRRFDRLQLRPGGHDGWAVPFGSGSNQLAFHATYMRDEFFRRTEQAQGRLAPYGRFVHLYINGLYWGIYDIHEVPSADFFNSHVGGGDENWDVVEHISVLNTDYDIVDGNGDAMDQLLSLCRPATRPADPLNYDQIEQYLDLDDYIDHMIVMIWGAQNDWVGPVFLNGANYSRFFNKNWNAGRLSRGPFFSSFLFSAWDAEISMGTHLTGNFTTHRHVNFDHTRVGEPGFSTSIPPGPPAEIYNALRSNPRFRERFADRLHKNFFNNGPMTVANNQARWNAMRTQLMTAIVAESARWGDVNGVDFTREAHWLPEVDWIRDTYIPQRNAIVLSQFNTRGLYPSVDPPTFSQFGGLALSGFQLTMTDPNVPAGTIYYTTDGSDPHQHAGPIQTKLVTAATPAKYWIPTSGVLGDTWKEEAPPANIGIWTDSTSAIGFDSQDTYLAHFTTNASEMAGVANTMYVRIPFTITSQAQLDSITAMHLRVKYDDGIHTYLNGLGPINSLNTPATAPAWNDAAPGFNPDGSAAVYEVLDWTALIPTLHVGTNWLCIQALNQHLGSSDFLIAPELIITTGAVADGPSPTAQAYSGPVPLTQTGTVKARVLSGSVWSALTEATFIVGTPANATNLVISEINYNPSGPTPAEVQAGFTNDSDFEYIELYNPTADTLELTGLRFVFGIQFDFINSAITSLAPGGRLLIVKNAAAFEARYGAGLPVAGQFEAGSGLSNSGERLTLLNATNATIFDFTYDDTAPWPNPPGGSGLSLVLIRPETIPNPALPANWRLSGYPNGSPNSDDRLTFASWLAANGGTGTETSDGDEDNLWNLTEYFLNGLPAVSSQSPLPVASIRQYSPGGVTGNYLTLTFTRRLGLEDVSYFVEFGTSIDAINQPGVLDDVDYNLDGTVTERWRSNTPISASVTQFGRVRIVK